MKFIDILFCDDIRHELNNKLSVMGLYNERLVLNTNKENVITWPQPINLSALLRFSLDAQDERPSSFEFTYLLNKKDILQIKGDLRLIDESRFQLILNGLGIPLEPGQLGFSITLYNHGKLLLTKKNESALLISASGQVEKKINYH
jgi:hypothetical protein